MGYESKIDIIGAYDESIDNALDMGRDAYAELIMSMNLCVMGYGNGFTDLFKRPLRDYHLEYFKGGEQPINGCTEDNYGKPYMVANVKDVYDWCKNDIKASKDKGERPYRRTVMLRDALKPFTAKKDWDDMSIFVVHSGY